MGGIYLRGQIPTLSAPRSLSHSLSVSVRSLAPISLSICVCVYGSVLVYNVYMLDARCSTVLLSVKVGATVSSGEYDCND